MRHNVGHDEMPSTCQNQPRRRSSDLLLRAPATDALTQGRDFGFGLRRRSTQGFAQDVVDLALEHDPRENATLLQGIDEDGAK